MKDYFSEHARRKAYRDAVLYGRSLLKTKRRSKLNPFRYLMGTAKLVYIPARKIFKSDRKLWMGWL